MWIARHKLVIFINLYYLKYLSTYTVHIPSFIKILLESRPFLASVKGGYGKIVKFTDPVIFVSNYDCVSDDAIRSPRLFV